MFRILKINFRFHALWLALLLLLLMLLGVLQAVTPGRGAFSGLIAGAGFGNLMMVVFLARQSHYSGELLMRTLPVDPTVFIATMYIMIAILCLGSAAFGFIFRDLIDIVTRTPINHHQLDQGYRVVHSIIARLISWWILVAIAIPFVIRFGNALRIVVGYVVMGAVHTVAVFPLLKVSVDGTSILGLNGWIAFVMTLLIISSILSFMISSEVYQRKEF